MLMGVGGSEDKVLTVWEGMMVSQTMGNTTKEGPRVTCIFKICHIIMLCSTMSAQVVGAEAVFGTVDGWCGKVDGWK